MCTSTDDVPNLTP